MRMMKYFLCLPLLAIIFPVMANWHLPENLDDYHGDKVKVIYKVTQQSARKANAILPYAHSQALFPLRNSAKNISSFYTLGLDRYYSIEVDKNLAVIKQLLDKLNQDPSVEMAYLEPVILPEKNAIIARTEDLSERQGYLDKYTDDGSKLGLNVRSVWPLPGGKGQGVDIVSLECGAYFFQHADLPPPFLVMGDPSLLSYWLDHTTSSVGIMSSIDIVYVRVASKNLSKVKLWI